MGERSGAGIYEKLPTRKAGQASHCLAGYCEPVFFDAFKAVAGVVKELQADNARLQSRVAELEGENQRLRESLSEIRKQLGAIVCTEGIDAGVVLLSHEGPTHFDPEVNMQVYDHEYFSPLGDALIALHCLTKKAD